MAYSTPRTWVAGDVLTAAQLNQDVRDNLNAAFPVGVDAWTTYTPTLTQLGAVTKTVTRAKYMQEGRKITVSVDLAITGTGTAANAVLIGLPVTAATLTTDSVIGAGFVFDSSTTSLYHGICVQQTTTTVAMYGPAVTGVGYLGVQQFTAALASGDRVTFTVTYEAA